MKQREWRNVIDKTAWGDGPWQNEPDKLQWQDAATGLPCLALRNQVSGTLCGYVGVMGGHRVYGALFESSYQLEDGTAKVIEAREVAEAERKAAKVKDPLHRKIIVDGARLMAIARRHGPYGFQAVERYLEVHGGVTYGGEGQPAAGRSTFERMRTIGRLEMQARAVGYPQGDAHVKSECANLARQLNALGPRRSWVARY